MKPALTAVLLVLLATLVACGGSSKPDSAASAASTAASAASTAVSAATTIASVSSPPAGAASPVATTATASSATVAPTSAPPTVAPAATQPPAATPNPVVPLITNATDRIRIASIGVDAPLILEKVGADGVFPDPGFDAVGIFDLSAIAGFGGMPGAGNTVVIADIGSGAGGKYGPFGNADTFAKVQVGDEVSFSLSGRQVTYHVVARCVTAYKDPSLAGVVRSTAVDTLTFIQAVGGGDALYYVAERQPNTVAPACPVGRSR